MIMSLAINHLNYLRGVVVRAAAYGAGGRRYEFHTIDSNMEGFRPSSSLNGVVPIAFPPCARHIRLHSGVMLLISKGVPLIETDCHYNKLTLGICSRNGFNVNMFQT